MDVSLKSSGQSKQQDCRTGWQAHLALQGPSRLCTPALHQQRVEPAGRMPAGTCGVRAWIPAALIGVQWSLSVAWASQHFLALFSSLARQPAPAIGFLSASCSCNRMTQTRFLKIYLAAFPFHDEETGTETVHHQASCSGAMCCPALRATGPS